MSNFILKVLKATEGKWELEGCPDSDELSKWVVLPVYFIFTRSCNDTLYSTRLDRQRPPLPEPMVKNGMLIQNSNDRHIVLAPIALLGPIVYIPLKFDN